MPSPPKAQVRPVGKGSLVDAATKLLRDRVLDLSLEPGRKLDEQLLAERFGLSRTPTREALNRLGAEGLIDIHSNRGAYVTRLDLDHVSQLFEAYILGERMVGFLCRTEEEDLVRDLGRIQGAYDRVQAKRDLLNVTRENAEFHTRLARATQNTYVYDHCRRLYNIARRVSFFIYRSERDPLKSFHDHALKINRHHERIIQCVADGDNAALIDVLTEHALLFRLRVTRVLTESHGEEFPVDWRSAR